jgi:hypothetical protein
LDLAQFGGRGQDRRIQKVFDLLNTADFELVMQRLEAAAEILELYDTGNNPRTLQQDSQAVREALANTLADVHPDRIGDVGDGRLDRCHDFLVQFDEIFTTNYDLLLYWAINRKDRAHFKDGFWRQGDHLVHMYPQRQNVSWLHGAVHLHEDLVPGDKPTTIKREWSAGVPLVDGLREDLEQGRMPLMVMEGTWDQKQRKINSSPYLSNCLQLLREFQGTLFTYGFSMSDNDRHILAAIQDSKITYLYAGLYGDVEDGSNPQTVGQAHRLRAESATRIKVRFWDTSSAEVW